MRIKKLFDSKIASTFTFSLLMHIFVPILLIVLVVVFQLKELDVGRARHLERSSMNAQDLGSTLASSISGAFQNIDLTLLAASDHIREGYKNKNIDQVVLTKALNDLQSRVPSLILLRATNAKGDIVFNSSSNTSSTAVMNVADRNYFQQLKNNPNAGMVVSEPLIGRITKKWVLICGRRLTMPNGEFNGIVYASIELDGVADRLAGGTIKLNGDDVILLRDDHKNVIVRFVNGNQDLALIGKKLTSPNLDALDQSGATNGFYVATSVVDHVERSYYFQRINGQPMNLVVGISVKDALAEWRVEAEKTWLMTGFLIGVIILSAYLIYKSKLRQMQAFLELQNIRIALEQSNQELARLSTTDSLTGLANRRKFEEVSAHEWLRAQRKQEPLTVAMVDVDFFKIYNDLYGHQAGDQCLKLVAQTLSAGLRDGSDFVARFGGEEFIILLPGQHAEGAYDVLERLRQDIASKKQTHTGSKFLSVVTFSVGFAVTIPKAGKAINELIEQADQNLYIAKRNGKNQVVGTNELGLLINSDSIGHNQTYGA